jgi:hypothetical protein
MVNRYFVSTPPLVEEDSVEAGRFFNYVSALFFWPNEKGQKIQALR